MADVTKEDLDKLHDRINDSNNRISHLNDSLNTLVVQVTRIATHMEGYQQPCHWHTELRKQFDNYLTSGDKQKTIWQEAVIKALINCIQMAVIGLIVYWITTH